MSITSLAVISINAKDVIEVTRPDAFTVPPPLTPDSPKLPHVPSLKSTFLHEILSRILESFEIIWYNGREGQKI